MSVLVVGASAAGLAVLEALRRKGFQGDLTLLGAEPHLPYDRPPLSKQVLCGTWDPERARLRPESALTALSAELVLGDPAVGLDVETRTVHTKSGRELRADAIVIATGLRPRALPGQAGLAGVHVLRTLDDALALRADLLSSRRLVVVGDGVLGAEVAATASGMGVDVTLAGPQAAPLASQFGPMVAGMLAELHTRHGVRLRLGTAVSDLTSIGICNSSVYTSPMYIPSVGRFRRLSGVRLETGEVLPADVVVVALGATPATDWLEGSGLRLENGVVCDSHCRAAPGIYAVGDVARWHHDRLGTLLRLENRTNATEQASVVATNLLGEDQAYTPIPYFWTDQYDTKIQAHGVLPAGAEVTVVDGDRAGLRFVAQYRLGEQVTGVLGWNMPKQTRLRRQELTSLGGMA